MRHGPTTSGIEGHLNGGPLRFKPSHRALLPALLGALLGCATVGGTSPATPRSATFARPLEIYRELGLLTGSTAFPAVADIATLAGPADSTLVLLALSLPNSALRFQRDAHGFFAEYRIELALLDPDSTPVQRMSARETVRVPSFAETGRTDESIIFQKAIRAAPGRYLVRLEAADAHSARGFRAFDTITVPDYSRGGISPIFLVHEAAGRTALDSLPSIIINARRTAAYGAESPRAYIESYGSGAVQLHLTNERGDTVWQHLLAFRGEAGPVQFAVVDLPADVLPVGRFTVAAVSSDPAQKQSAPLVMTISDQWMVGSMDDVLQLLTLIAHDDEIEPLRTGTPAQRRTAWDEFWKRRDPLPITELNEYRDQFFERVRYAADAFRESAGTGWMSDRGRVYIVLGPPDQILERGAGIGDLTGQSAVEEWTYVNAPGGRVSLLFHDRTGFGQFELVPSSAATFRGIVQRLKSRSAG